MGIVVLILAIVLLIGSVVLKNRFVAVFCFFFVGLSLMMFANSMYMSSLSLYYSSKPLNDYGLVSVISSVKGLSVSDTKIISVIGASCILASFIVCALMISKQSKRWYLVLFLLIGSYIWINLPDTAYKFYLMINCGNIAAQRNFAILKLVNSIIIMICFAAPFAASFIRQRKTILMPVKRYLLIFNLSMVFFDAVLILLMYKGIINNFTDLSIDLFYKNSVPEKFTVSVYVQAEIFLIFAVAGFAAIKSKALSTYSTSSKLSQLTNTYSIDKNLRMVLHTYKNMFFVIKQMSGLVIDLKEERSQQTEECISTINNISNIALMNITSQLEMLHNIDASFRDVELMEVINIAVEKAAPPKRIEVKINYNTYDKYICSDVFYLSELFYNLIKNACEAVADISTPRVEINVFSEDDWFMVEVCDNGCGIEKKNRKKIFKPLVSQKQGQNNWGIGLYYVQKIVQAFSGYMFLDSAVGEYTKFQVYLPKYSKSGRKDNKNE